MKSRPKLPIRQEITLRGYSIVERAVDHGLTLGLSRARKHTNYPSNEALLEHLHREVMLAITEVLDFSDPS